MRIKLWLLIGLSPMLLSCSNDDDDDDDSGSDDKYNNGVFISNEGPFQGGNGTLSWYDLSDKSVTNDLFLSEVGRPLGNVVHSVHVFDDYLYIVVNNSGVVEVVEADEMEHEMTITGLTNPRYAQGISEDIVAITDWGTNTVEIINASNSSGVASISTGNGPERMLLNGNTLYVANSGGFGLDSTVVLIDITSNAAVDTFYVGYNPNSMIIDANGALWVLCGGYTDWGDPSNNLPGSLYRLNATTGAVQDTFQFGDAPRPTGLCTGPVQQEMYFLDNGYGGNPYRMSYTATELPSTPMVTGANGYAIGLDPRNLDLYIADPVDYASQGKVYRMDVVSGAMLDTLNVGIIPGNFEFN